MRSAAWFVSLALLGCGVAPRDGAAHGAPCTADDECQGGACLAESQVLFQSGGPPGGICSESCDDEDNCPADTVCTPTSRGSFCLLGCEFGDDAAKCGARSAYACEPLLFPNGVDCEEDTDCESGESCVPGPAGSRSCSLTLGVCTPRCGSDADCNDGRFCHLGSGECVEEEPSGLASGEACDPAVGGCRGSCVSFADGSSQCVEYCRAGAASGCGEADLASSARACEQFAYGDLGVEQGAGDTGVCSAR